MNPSSAETYKKREMRRELHFPCFRMIKREERGVLKELPDRWPSLNLKRILTLEVGFEPQERRLLFRGSEEQRRFLVCG